MCVCVFFSLFCLTAQHLSLRTTCTLQLHVGLFGWKRFASLHFDKHSRTHCVHAQSWVFIDRPQANLRESEINGERDKVGGRRDRDLDDM